MIEPQRDHALTIGPALAVATLLHLLFLPATVRADPLAVESSGWLNAKDFGASGSPFQTTAAVTAGSKQITVAEVGDFNIGQGVLPKNSIWRLYQPTGHKSNWVTTEKMATKKPGILRESGCFTGTRRPVVMNQPGKTMFTITQHASSGGVFAPCRAADEDRGQAKNQAPRFNIPVFNDQTPQASTFP